MLRVVENILKYNCTRLNKEKKKKTLYNILPENKDIYIIEVFGALDKVELLVDGWVCLVVEYTPERKIHLLCVRCERITAWINLH